MSARVLARASAHGEGARDLMQGDADRGAGVARRGEDDLGPGEGHAVPARRHALDDAELLEAPLQLAAQLWIEAHADREQRERRPRAEELVPRRLHLTCGNAADIVLAVREEDQRRSLGGGWEMNRRLLHRGDVVRVETDGLCSAGVEP